MNTLAIIALAGLAVSAGAQTGQSVKGLKLKVSANGRFLQEAGGKPFFYLGDTAWTLFKRLTREEADEYLRNRAKNGFTVIQAYVFRGLNVRNVHGDLTVIDRDPARLNEAFFRNVDWIVNRANELGLVMGMVVTYGEHVNGKVEKVFDVSNAYTYGKLLGARYKDNAIIWLLGGDRNPQEDVDIWSSMARGLKDGCNRTQLVSYHGPGPRNSTGYSSSFWFHDKDWLDFNMIQSGHSSKSKTYEFIAHDYALTPIKPTIDMEARYEDAPDGGYSGDLNKRMDARHSREAAYWAMLAGAAGQGYGCNNIWQFYNPERLPPADDRSFPYARYLGTKHWRESLDFPGALSMGVLRKLFQLYPWHKLAPDQSIIAAGQGEKEGHIQAARAADGSFALAYLPFGDPLSIHMNKFRGAEVKAQWFDPRKGAFTSIGSFANRGQRQFTPPSKGEKNDWVLALGEAGR